MLMKNKQTMQVKKFLSIGAKWSVQRAQTRERGPPSAPAEVINNSSLTISRYEIIFIYFVIKIGIFKIVHKIALFAQYLS